MTQVKKPKVLLVGWDAADWEHMSPLLEQGQLPTISGLIKRGVAGNLGTLEPMLSPMLWNSIATGKQPYKHGIHGFIEPDPVHGGARPYSSVSRRCKALWNILSQKGYRCNVVNWWASHPAEPVNGCVVSNCFAGTKPDAGGVPRCTPGVVHPAKLSDALAQNKVFPDELTGEQLLPFVPRGAGINQNDDNRLAILANNVSELLSTHALATDVMVRSEWDFMAVYYTAIDHFSHAFMMYHPPRLPWIPEEDFELYKDVINGAYRFSDMALRRLMDLAGPDTTVVLCSDHGFHSRELRPRFQPNEPAGPAAWHRRFGVFLAAGPDIKQGDRVVGATLLDVAPTILSMFSLPSAEDMDGRSLDEIFVKSPDAGMIPSWESVPGESGMHAGGAAVSAGSAAESEELLHQFVALGYIEAPGATKEEQAEAADTEAKYNLSRNLAWCGKHQEAIEVLTGLVHRAPWESRFLAYLARSCAAAGHLGAAEHVLRSAFDLDNTLHAGIRMIWIDVLLKRRRYTDAARAMQALADLGPTQPDVLNALARNYMRMGEWDKAERLLKRCLDIHPASPEANESLARIYCHRGMNQETIDTALNAINTVYRMPEAHLSMGIALTRSGNPEPAANAFLTALRLQPRMRAAHRWLNYIYHSELKDPAKAEHHKREAARLEREDRAAAEAAAAAAPRDPDAFKVELPALGDEFERDRVLAIKRQPPVNPSVPSGKTFVLVSGLPRSGTSLMMQMLEAGGLPAKTDGERAADPDNPKGYYEWEAIKGVVRQPQIMDEEGLDRKAIKAVSALLPQMPYQHRYKIIFMLRPVEEVANSQAAMIERLHTTGAKLSTEALCAELREHRDQVLLWLSKHPRAEHLVIDYPALVKDPGGQIDRVAKFLGSELLPHPEQMRGAIDASLYRKRGS